MTDPLTRDTLEERPTREGPAPGQPASRPCIPHQQAQAQRSRRRSFSERRRLHCLAVSRH